MAEILFAGGQIVCIAGYLYGAWLVLSHAASTATPARAGNELPPGADAEERAVWERYLACDS